MTYGSSSEKTVSIPSSTRPRVYSSNRISAARPAEPIAYPFVTAFVVLPTASSWSVIVAYRLRHVCHLGDATRVVRDGTERVEGDDQAGHRELGHDGDADPVDVAARDLVGRDDAARDHDHRAGSVASMPFARPAMMFVAWPVVEAEAIFFTGLQRLPV